MAGTPVRLGTSSWTDPTLTKSGWYPKKSMPAEDRLRFYAAQFSVVEVDATYYRLPSARNSELWVERTPGPFCFDIKAFGLLTQHPVVLQAVPPDLHSEIEPAHRDKKRVYLEHLSKEGQDEVWRLFLEPLEPLRAAGRMGFVLLQFPKWFPGGRDNREYVAKCVERIQSDRVAVEFRHGSWMKDEWADRTLQFLESIGASYVCVDEPQGFASSLPPVTAATAALAVVRFHGRNAETWEKQDISAAERFAYDYPTEELQGWVDPVRRLAEQAEEVHVMFNNCYSDYGVRNAATMAQLLQD